jgi:two-component system sensor histidine kinase VicK
LAFTKAQNLGAISTAEPGVIRNAEDIKGVLIADISLQGLWQSVLSGAQNDVGKSYAYVVDDHGTIIAHPDNSLPKSQFNASLVPVVELFLGGGSGATNFSTEGVSEKNVASLATYQAIPTANWAVIYQQPLTSIYANVEQVSRVGLALTVAVILLVVLLSLLVSRYFTWPIVTMAAIAERIGRGEFDATVPAIHRTDEIAVLGTRINAMGQSLKKFVERIETERSQLEIILNSTAEGIIAIGDENRIVIANNAAGKLTNQVAQAMVGQHMGEVFPWTKNKKAYFIDYMGVGNTTYEDLEYKAPDGATHYVDVVVSHVDTSVEDVRAIITIHDETKSRELDNMKIDFVSLAAHELRTPITGIRGYLELLLYKFNNELNDQIKSYIHHAHNSSIELIGLINNLLSISRIERGALTLTMEKIDWTEAINRAVLNAQFNAKEKKVTIKPELPGDLCYVVADTIAIQEVLNNLLGNAIKYTPEGGQITVRLTQKDGQFTTEVVDNGMGIPASAIDNLFTKFYRVHGGLASGSGGTGLGLFISKSIVERHGGKIWAQSKEGEGSTFAFTLPVFTEGRLQMYQLTQVSTTRRHRGWTTKNITR